MCRAIEEMLRIERQEGWKEGYEEGRMIAQIQLIEALLADGVEMEEIAEYSGFPLEEVKRLAAEWVL